MGTKYQGSLEAIQALNCYIKLIRCADSVTARVHRHLEAVHLSVSQFGVLEAIYHLGPLCQKDLGIKLLKSGGNITVVIDNLEKRQLVRRERAPNDRRMILIHLTPVGTTLIEKIFPDHVQKIIHDLQVLRPEEQRILEQLCGRLGKGQSGRLENLEQML